VAEPKCIMTYVGSQDCKPTPGRTYCGCQKKVSGSILNFAHDTEFVLNVFQFFPCNQNQTVMIQVSHRFLLAVYNVKLHN
jgi:hypothetical protein